MDEQELPFAGLLGQAEAVRRRDVSPRELVELTLRRIERLDPQLNSFRVVLAERALAEAAQAEARLRAGEERPFLGVPVSIKDDTDVAGERTTRGIDMLMAPAERDAYVVRRLREAGAIVIGKTAVPELESHNFTETVSFGATRNPWSLAHTPGGSSGGAAAALAAGLCGASQGTDGAGSIRGPAASCRLFGIKPARGRISLAPLPDRWHGLDVTGPLTQTVADAAAFLDATHGSSPIDAIPPAPPPAEPFAAAAARSPRRLRVALSFKIPPGLVARIDPDVRRVVSETADLLRSLGHDVVERDPDYGRLVLSATARVLRGISDDAEAYRPPSRLERRTRRRIRRARLISDGLLARARREEPGLAARVNAIFDDVDVLLTPATMFPPWEVGRFETSGESRLYLADSMMIAFLVAWNVLGNPAASVPAGFSGEGLPLSAHLVGRPNDEHTLLSLAAQLESERPWRDRRPPLA